MFDDVLIESAGKDKRKGTWVNALISGVLHVGVIGGIIAAGYYVKENPHVIEKPIAAFIVAAAPPPPKGAHAHPVRRRARRRGASTAL